MNTISFLPNFHQTSSKPSSAKPIRFGRDALYERNKPFVNPADIPDDIFEYLEYQTQAKKSTHPIKAKADALADKGQLLYEFTGRYIDGDKALPQALKAALQEYELRQQEVRHYPGSGSETAMHIAGVKLANAQLAEDGSKKSNEKAFQLLCRSLDRLQALGYLDQKSVSPVVIHGLYNRGAYAFNNDLRQSNIAKYGINKVIGRDLIFEGLLVTTTDKNRFRNFKNIEKGIKYIEQAIGLADTIPDNQLAKAEYLIALGEMQHALAHLSPVTVFYAHQTHERPSYQDHSSGARMSFAKARKLLDNVKNNEARYFTPRHQALWDNLVNIKQKHLCSDSHRTSKYDASKVCMGLPSENEQMQFKANRTFNFLLQNPHLKVEDLLED